MKIKDNRTEDQKNTHACLVVGTDTFMSNWGDASGKASYAAWACEPADVQKVTEYVAGRCDMKNVRMVIDRPGSRYRPSARYCAHLHIYLWSDR